MNKPASEPSLCCAAWLDLDKCSMLTLSKDRWLLGDKSVPLLLIPGVDLTDIRTVYGERMESQV